MEIGNSPGAEQALQGFDDCIIRSMKLWRVPGLAVSIVKDGQVVQIKGYGLRDVGRHLPVTPETVFAIGSATKAFTTMTMGIMVDEGKLDWDRPVSDYLASFRLQDRFASERMTPRDLVCHRSGLPRHDAVWYNSPLSRSELFDRLQYLEPSKDFRSYFQYQNLMFMAAGYLVGKLAGSSWEEYAMERLLTPLGMASSSFSVLESSQAPNTALPYWELDGQVETVPFRNLDAMGPAGSINSNVVDMTNWLLLHLGKGQFNDQQIISEAGLAQIHAPQTVIQEMIITLKPFMPYGVLSPGTYGLGWFLQTYRGHLMIHHGGAIDGFLSYVSFMPRENIGMVVLGNLDMSPLPVIVTLNAYDRLLGLEPLPWNERAREGIDRINAGMRSVIDQFASARVEGTQPSHPLADYAGEYYHPAYGTAKVLAEGDQLAFSCGGAAIPLRHYHYDVFEYFNRRVGLPIPVSFHSNLLGTISKVSVPLEPTVKEIVFDRMDA